MSLCVSFDGAFVFTYLGSRLSGAQRRPWSTAVRARDRSPASDTVTWLVYGGVGEPWSESTAGRPGVEGGMVIVMS
ncbi:hypothetical protein SPBR_06302 [Sporothrix brasiliensis 5110]|uniref:Uncharacterized protein n=1 Tax=Sporothrix brasiliensis 5110 TaxID=1398154 RepID=A0A0C2FSP9_9PEZI|nr:uncharacterized protein SPBR_06302 [Sporothrix brasiliensis 5110]KIH94048.1 hypothetical protein SPBR_06302 [Sporothrix brasiliensis 5110]